VRKLAFLLVAACGHQAQPHVTIATPPSASQQHVAEERSPARIDVDGVLAWLPSDTVSVIVVRGPFDMPAPDHRPADAADMTKPLLPEVTDEIFRAFALGLFGLDNGGALKPLVGQKVLVAINAVARFRSPKGLGEGPYDGCSIAVLERAPHLGGGDFSKKYEADVWTTHVAFVDDVALVCTDETYMHALETRMKAHVKERAFLLRDDDAWKHVDTSAAAWGLHVAGNERATFAVGDGRLRIVVSGAQSEAIAHKLASEAKATEAHADGVLEVSLSLGAPAESVMTSMFYLEALLGHVIFL
jgi:hypothetical protein